MNAPPEEPEGQDHPVILPLSSELLAALQAHRAARRKGPQTPLRLAPGDALRQPRPDQPHPEKNQSGKKPDTAQPGKNQPSTNRSEKQRPAKNRPGPNRPGPNRPDPERGR